MHEYKIKTSNFLEIIYLNNNHKVFYHQQMYWNTGHPHTNNETQFLYPSKN